MRSFSRTLTNRRIARETRETRTPRRVRPGRQYGKDGWDDGRFSCLGRSDKPLVMTVNSLVTDAQRWRRLEVGFHPLLRARALFLATICRETEQTTA